MPPKAELFGAGLVLSMALMAGRIAGFVREAMLAASFGLTNEADLAIVILTLPDLLVNLLLSGGLSVALIPVLRQATGDVAATLFVQASVAALLLFSGLAALFVFFPQWWFGLLAPGAHFSAVDLSYWALIPFAAALPLTALSGVSTAALNASDRFFVAGCGTVIFNLSIMGALVMSWSLHQPTMSWLCAGIAIGALLRWGSQLVALRQVGSCALYQIGRVLMLDRKLIRTFIHGLAAASLLILVPVCVRAVASLLGDGQLAAFNYALKLVELPLGILITTLATVAYPRLAQAYGDKDADLFNSTLSASIVKSLVLSVAVVICGWQFADAAVQLLLGYGRIGAQEQEQIAGLTQIALLSVPFVGISSLLAAALNARDQAGEVLKCNLRALLALLLLILPGLASYSTTLLMLALPLFFVVLTLILFRRLGLSISTLIPRSALVPMVLTIISYIPIALLDLFEIAVYFEQPKLLAMVRLIVALMAWSMAVYVGLKALQAMPRKI